MKLWWLNGFVTIITYAPRLTHIQGINGLVMGGCGTTIVDGGLISIVYKVNFPIQFMKTD